MRILCADDNHAIARTLCRVFAAAGHICEHAEDGIRAWAKLAADLSAYDVLVTDHDMPHLSGSGLLHMLRQVSFGGKVVVHCSPLSRSDAEIYRTLGIDGFVEKPASAERILAVVESACGLR